MIEDIASSYHKGFGAESLTDVTAEVLRAFNFTQRFRSKYLSDEQMLTLDAWIDSAIVVSTFRRKWDLIGVLRKRLVPRPQ